MNTTSRIGLGALRGDKKVLPSANHRQRKRPSSVPHKKFTFLSGPRRGPARDPGTGNNNCTRMALKRMMGYRMFLLMLVISFVIMYGVMFLNVDDASHIYLSTTRAYMALLMVLPMAVVMMLMMGKMYPNKKLNTAIIIGSVVLFGVFLAALRTQTAVGDVQYMKAMIPHHSSAILTSKNAAIKDPEVKKLAESIIESQEREIAEMKALLARMNNK